MLLYKKCILLFRSYHDDYHFFTIQILVGEVSLFKYRDAMVMEGI